MGWFKNRRLKKERETAEKIEIGVFKATQKIKAQLGFTQGNNRLYGSGGGKWPYSISGNGSGIYLNHATARQNARTAYFETTQAKAMVDRFADTVADVGLVLECTPKASILGLPEEVAEAWASDVETRFDLWARSKKQHRAELYNFYQSHRLYQIFQHRDNDIFTRLYYSKDRNLLNPLQFDFIDPSQIRGDAITSSLGIHSYQDGIIRDARGREKAYKIWVQKKNEPGFDQISIPRVGEKSKRIFMLHGFCPVFAGQGRGYSGLAHIIQEFQNITDFTLAQVKKAINQSNITMFVEPSDDAPATNPLDSLQTNRGAGPAAVQFGDSPTPAEGAQGVTPEALLSPVDYYALPEVTIDSPGSTGVFNLNAGESLKAFEGKTPADNFDTFVDAFCSYLAASKGMPLEVLLMKFGTSYSASRAALVLFWRVAQIWRDEMAADYLNPIVEMWLSEEIAAQRIEAPGWLDPTLRAAWLNCRWIGSPMPNIDPMRTAKADKTYAELGAHDLDRVARNHNGSDGRSNRAKLKRQYSELPEAPWNKQKGDTING
jgi:capsid protein